MKTNSSVKTIRNILASNFLFDQNEIDYFEASRALNDGIMAIERDEWHLVSEWLPEEHNSIYADLYGTNKWNPGLFRHLSDNVLVTIDLEIGKRFVSAAHTVDGKWNFGNGCVNKKVIAWKPFPTPLAEGDKNNVI